MPVLPSAASIPDRAARASGRPIAQIQTSDLMDAGAQAVAKGIGSVATTTYRLGEQAKVKDQQLNTARADAEWLTKEPEIHKQFTPDDPNYEKWAPTYQEQSTKLRSEIADKYIQDPRARDLWTLKRQSDIVRGTQIVTSQADKINKDYYYTTGVESLDNLKKTYLDPSSDENMRLQVVEAGKGVVEDMRARGLITQEQAQRFGQKWASDVETAQLSMLSPLERIAAVGGNKAALRARESSGNPAIVNQFGYAGSYQFGAPRLQTIGIYTPGAGEDLVHWSKSPRGASGKWSGTFNIPGFPDVKTLKDFLANPKAQEAAFDVHDQKMEQEIKDNGLSKYVGQTVGGVKITTDGLKNMMHLGGVGGAKKALESDGKDVVRDANGTSVLDYARMGASASRAERTAAFVSPEDRQRIEAGAERDYRTELRQQEVTKRNESAEIDKLRVDDLASIERTGKGVESLTRERIAATSGEDAAREWEAERVRAFKVHEALDGIDKLPEGEVEKRLQMMEPVPGSEGYADDMKAYERARQKSEKFLQARRADPALASEVFDTVRTAKQNAQYTDVNGVRTVTPESAQAIVGARLAAQGQLGVAEPMAVTKSEASVIARQLRSIGEDNPDQMRKFMESLNKTYGDYADEVLAATIQHQNVNRDLSVMASQVLSKIAQGTMPGSPEMQRVESLIDAQTMEKVLPPPPLSRELQDRKYSKINGVDIQRMRKQQEEELARGNPVSPPEGTPNGLATPEGVADIKRLIADPSLATEFNLKYEGGPGFAEKILKEYARRKGQPNG